MPQVTKPREREERWVFQTTPGCEYSWLTEEQWERWATQWKPEKDSDASRTS